MRVYLAGPMTGIPQFNYPSFDWAAAVLRARGHEVFSPAEADSPETRAAVMASPDGSILETVNGETWESFLGRALQRVVTGGYDVIVTLGGWERSRGARCEVALARELGIPRADFDSAFYAGFRTEGVAPVDTHGQEIRTLVGVTHGYEPSALLAAVESDPLASEEDLLLLRPWLNGNVEVYDPDGNFIRHEDNPDRQRSVHGGVKDNRGKSRLDLLPTKPLVAAGAVLDYGARKYKPNNWRLGLAWGDTYASAMRHLTAFMDGEDLDPETGHPHMAHALCQVLFLTEYFLTGTGTDDRWSSQEDREAARA